MKTSLRIAVAVAIVAGAGLSGCAFDPYYDNPGYSQGYHQPVFHAQRYYGTSTQYYEQNNPSRAYYLDRPYYYQSR